MLRWRRAKEFFDKSSGADIAVVFYAGHGIEVDGINYLIPIGASAAERRPPFPHWENGLVDLWDDEPAAHPVAAIRHGLHEHIRRRIWTAQAGLMLPFTHRILRSLIQRYRDVLDRLISPSRPFRKAFNDRTETIIDPGDLEFYDFREHTRHLLSTAELHLIKTAQWCRNAVAHRDIIPPETIERLSDLYVDNFDLLETDIPGWNWPRCGQTLSMTAVLREQERAPGPQNKGSM